MEIQRVERRRIEGRRVDELMRRKTTHRYGRDRRHRVQESAARVPSHIHSAPPRLRDALPRSLIGVPEGRAWPDSYFLCRFGIPPAPPTNHAGLRWMQSNFTAVQLSSSSGRRSAAHDERRLDCDRHKLELHPITPDPSSSAHRAVDRVVPRRQVDARGSTRAPSCSPKTRPWRPSRHCRTR